MMYKLNQKSNQVILKNIGLILVSLVAVICLVKVGEAAWQEPDTNPTVENPSAPITVSATPQQKTGKLNIIGDPLYIGSLDSDFGSLTSTDYLEINFADLQVEQDLHVQQGNLQVGNDVFRADSEVNQVVINNSENFASTYWDQTTLYVTGRGSFVSDSQTAVTAENYQSPLSSVIAQMQTVYVRNESSTSPAILGQSLSSQGGGGILGKGGDTRNVTDETYAIKGISGSGTGNNIAAIFGAPDITESGIVGINNFEFIYAGSLNNARRNHTATLLGDGRVLIAGGYDGLGNVIASAELYDPLTGEFVVAGSSLQRARFGHTATLLPDGTVLIVGGSNDALGVITTPGEMIEIFDPETDAFSFCPTCDDLIKPRVSHTATLLSDDRVFIIGGMDAGNQEVGSTEFFEVSQEFTAGPSMNYPRSEHTATLLSDLEDKVFVVGGYGPIDNWGEYYDPDLIDFIKTDDQTWQPRKNHTATLLEDGRVFITGGYNIAPPGGLAGTDLYDPASNTFSNGPTMTSGRAYHRAEAMGNGLVLIIGGLDENNEPVTLMDVFDPDTDTYIASLDDGGDGIMTDEELIGQLSYPEFNPPVLNTARHLHTMTRLVDNRMLIVGGLPALGEVPITKAEITEEALEVDWSGTITNLTAEFLDGHPAEDFVRSGTKMSSAALKLNQEQQSNLYLSGQGIFEGGLRVSLSEPDTDNALTAVNTSENGGIGVSVQAKSAAWGQTTYAVYSRASGDQTWAAYFDGQVRIVTNKSGAGSFIQTDYLDQTTSHIEATVLENGQVFMAGGNQGSAADDAFTSDAYLFDPMSGQLQKLADLSQARTGHQITNYEDDVLISGGYSSSYGQTTDSAIIYDPDSNTYLEHKMILNRAEHSTTQLEDGRIFVAGGYNRNEAIAYTEIFDGSFGEGPVLPQDQQRGGHTATLLIDGRVLLVGGKQGTDYPYLADGLIFNPVDNQITVTGDQFNQSVNHTATRLSDGQVLVVGGQYHEESLSRVQIYDPDTDSVIDLPNLHLPRYGHSTQLLSDGRVLVIGGRNDQGYLASYEIFNPNVNPIGQWQLIDDARMPDQPATFSALVALADDYLLLAGGQNTAGKSNSVSVYHPYQPPLVIGDEQAPVIEELDCQFLDGFAQSDLVRADNDILNQYYQLNKNNNNLNLAGIIQSDSSAELSSLSAPAVISRAGNSLYSVYTRGSTNTTAALQASSPDDWAGYFQTGSTAGQTKTEVAGQLALAGPGIVFSGQAPTGSAAITSGVSSVTINNPQMTEDSQVLLSLTSASGTNQHFNLLVADKQNQSFTVETYPVVGHQSISFDYLIIN